MFEIPAFFLPITCLADFLQIYAHTLSSQRGLYFIFSVSKILVLFFQRSLSWLLVFNTTACSSASLLVLPMTFACSQFYSFKNYCTFQNPISSNYLLELSYSIWLYYYVNITIIIFPIIIIWRIFVREVNCLDFDFFI